MLRFRKIALPLRPGDGSGGPRRLRRREPLVADRQPNEDNRENAGDPHQRGTAVLAVERSSLGLNQLATLTLLRPSRLERYRASSARLIR